MRQLLVASAIGIISLCATPASAAAPSCPAEFKQGGKPDSREIVVACLLERLFTQGSARLGDLLDETAVLVEADGTPYPGRYTGEQLRGFDRIFNSVWRDPRVVVEDIFVSDGGAVALLRLSGTLVASGQRIEMPILERYLFAPDGRVTLIEPFYFDTAAFSSVADGRHARSQPGVGDTATHTTVAANLPGCPLEFRTRGKPPSRPETVACLLERVLMSGLRSAGDLLSDDAILIEAEGTPYPGTFTRDRFGEFDRLFAQSWREPRGSVFDFYASDSGAVIYGQVDAISRITGQRVSMRILERYVFAEDGRISLIQPFYFDTAALPRTMAPNR